MKKVAILQSNYIPWKGYFDIINSVDEFIIYDTMQYTKNDWRNRNQIKTAVGIQWLSIPVKIGGRISQNQTINQTQIADSGWSKKHWNAIKMNYAKSQCFKHYQTIFESLYAECSTESLFIVD